MTLVQFFGILIVGGLLWYLVDTYLPLPDIIKTVIRIICVILVIFLVGALFGLMPLPFQVK